jgi:hypothetical protein
LNGYKRGYRRRRGAVPSNQLPAGDNRPRLPAGSPV